MTLAGFISAKVKLSLIASLLSAVLSAQVQVALASHSAVTHSPIRWASWLQSWISLDIPSWQAVFWSCRRERAPAIQQHCRQMHLTLPPYWIHSLPAGPKPSHTLLNTPTPTSQSALRAPLKPSPGSQIPLRRPPHMHMLLSHLRKLTQPLEQYGLQQ